jgi:hypothetical protein
MDELGMEVAPGLAKVPVQARHLGCHGLAVRSVDAVQKRYKGLFDLIFHIEGEPTLIQLLPM